MTSPHPRRVGVIGLGAIGGRVAAELAGGAIRGARLSGVAAKRSRPVPPAPQLSIRDLVAASDVLVEAAGHEVVREHGAAILDAGRDLVLVSLGALGDPDVSAAIDASGPGKAVMCTGAVGGLDLLRAAMLMEGLSDVVLTTSKRPPILVQPWMHTGLVSRLEGSNERVVVFEGNPRDAARLFPSSVNVAAAISLALGTWELLRVRVVADPAAQLTSHVIEARGSAGSYRFEISNQPSEGNPATSAIVPYSVLTAVAELCDRPSG